MNSIFTEGGRALYLCLLATSKLSLENDYSDCQKISEAWRELNVLFP